MNKNDLQRVLDAKGISPRIYDLDGGLPEDRLCLSAEAGRWCVYYTERGLRFNEKHYDSEEDACRDLLTRVRKEAS